MGTTFSMRLGKKIALLNTKNAPSSFSKKLCGWQRDVDPAAGSLAMLSHPFSSTFEMQRINYPVGFIGH